MTNTTDKIRGVFLATLMVLSVVAMSASFAGAVAAQEPTTADRSIDSVELTPGETATVSISVEFDAEHEFQIIDNVDPALNPEVVDGPGNVNDGTVTYNYVEGLSGSTNATTVTYEVTVPEGATPGTTYTFDGTVQTDSEYTITGNSELTVVEEPTTGTIEGTVTDADGNAIDGATVNVQGADLSATTDANGEYTLADAPEGDHTLEVSADGYVTETTGVSVTADETTTQNFDLEETVGVAPTDVDTMFQGEELIVNVDGTFDGINGDQTSPEQGDILQIRLGILGDGEGDRVATAVVSDDYTATFDAGDMDLEEDFYFFRINGLNLAETQFEVIPQDLNAEVKEGPAYTDEGAPQAQIEVDSENWFNQRSESFWAEVNSDSLTQDELLDMFEIADTNLRTTEDDEDAPVQLEITERYDWLGMDFSDLDTGTYNFTIESATSTASDSVSVEYAEPSAVSGSISNTVSAVRGDVASFTIDLQNTDTAEVQVADLDRNYVANLTVEDASDDSDSDDGQVTVYMNTYLAGHDNSAAFYTSEDNTDMVTVSEDSTEIGEDFRLAAAGYNVQLLLNGDQADSAALDVMDRAPSADSISAVTAPAGNDFGSIDEITNGTQTDWAAFGDHLAFEVEATGIFGYLNDDFDTGGLSMTLTQENFEGAYANAPSFNVSGSAFELVPDQENNRFFVTVDTEALQDAEDLSDGDQYSVTFEINGENNDYLGDTTESVETMVTFEEPEVSFGTTEGGAPYQVVAEDGAEVHGTSTYAPGTELEIRASGGDIPTFQKYTYPVVQDDGTWTAEFDFGDRSTGEEFELRVVGESTTTEAVLTEDATGWSTGGSAELQQRVNELETLLNETMALLEERNQTIEELRQQLNETGGASQELLDEKNATIEELNQQLAQAESDLLNNTMTMADLNEQINALNLSVRTLEAENADLEDQVSSLQSMLEEKNSTVEEQQSTIDEQDSTISDLEDEVSSLEEDLAAAQETTTASGPGFTAVLALVALMGAALLAVRRQQ